METQVKHWPTVAAFASRCRLESILVEVSKAKQSKAKHTLKTIDRVTTHVGFQSTPAATIYHCSALPTSDSLTLRHITLQAGGPQQVLIIGSVSEAAADQKSVL